MIIPITIPRPGQFSPKLPPQLAQLGNDEIFLIELQGTLDVEGTEATQKDGQLIGNLNTSDMVRHEPRVDMHCRASLIGSAPAEETHPHDWTPPPRGKGSQSAKTTGRLTQAELLFLRRKSGGGIRHAGSRRRYDLGRGSSSKEEIGVLKATHASLRKGQCSTVVTQGVAAPRCRSAIRGRWVISCTPCTHSSHNSRETSKVGRVPSIVYLAQSSASSHRIILRQNGLAGSLKC